MDRSHRRFQAQVCKSCQAEPRGGENQAVLLGEVCSRGISLLSYGGCSKKCYKCSAQSLRVRRAVLSCSGLTSLYCSELRLLWRWPGSAEWNSPEILEMQDHDGEYEPWWFAKPFGRGKQTFPSSHMSLMYTVFTALIRGRLKAFLHVHKVIASWGLSRALCSP